MKRRTLIQATLAAAGGSAVAGCLGTDGDDAVGQAFPIHDLPADSEWVPATPTGEQDGVLFTRVDWETINELENGDDEDDEDDEAFDFIEDAPILGLPIYGLAISPLVVFGVAFYPFSDVIIPDPDTTEDSEGINTRTMTWADSVVVFHGEYDPSVFESQYADGFEATTTTDGFTVFEGVDEFTEGLAHAVSDETVVVGMQPGEDDEYEPTAEVAASLERAAEERDRVVDTEDGEWLFETTGPADIALGVWETDDLMARIEPEADEETEETDEPEPAVSEDNPVFDPVESVINTLSFDTEDGEADSLEARFAAIYPDGSVPSEDELRTHLIGDGTMSYEITIDEPRVHATATFEQSE